MISSSLAGLNLHVSWNYALNHRHTQKTICACKYNYFLLDTLSVSDLCVTVSFTTLVFLLISFLIHYLFCWINACFRLSVIFIWMFSSLRADTLFYIISLLPVTRTRLCTYLTWNKYLIDEWMNLLNIFKKVLNVEILLSLVSQYKFSQIKSGFSWNMML